MTYCVIVSGRGAPKVEHPTFERAFEEAERLSQLEPKTGIIVVEVVAKLPPRVLPSDVWRQRLWINPLLKVNVGFFFDLLKRYGHL